MFGVSKVRCAIAVTAVAVVASACGGIASSGSEGSVELRAANLLPPNGASSDMMDWFMDELEARTDGEVETEVVHGGGLVSGVDTLPGMQQGRAEAGNVVPAYFPADLPLGNIVAVPVLEGDQSTRLRALHDVAEQNEAFAEELERNDLVLIGFLPIPSATVAFNKPIGSLGDLQGSEIRIPSQPLSAPWEELGVSSVFMASEEVYEAVERGIVDGVTYPMDTQVAAGITEVAKYLAPDVGHSGGSLFAISRSAYDRLSDDAKDVVEELKGEWYEKADELLTQYESQACEEFLDDGGQIHVWNDADQARIDAAVEGTAVQAWREDAGQGIDDGVLDELWGIYTAGLQSHAGETDYTDGLIACSER